MAGVDLKPILSKDSMLSTLCEDGVLLDTATVAPSPSKDYCQLLISADEMVRFRQWKISCRALDHLLPPKEVKKSLQEFLRDATTRGDVKRVFGEATLSYVINLASGHLDYLPRLPNNILIKIIGYLPLDCIPTLSFVSKQFQELCRSDVLWQHLYRTHSGSRAVSADVAALAKRVGWRAVFFTNKLQLQVQLHRARGRAASSEQSVSTPQSSLSRRSSLNVGSATPPASRHRGSPSVRSAASGGGEAATVAPPAAGQLVLSDKLRRWAMKDEHTASAKMSSTDSDGSRGVGAGASKVATASSTVASGSAASVRKPGGVRSGGTAGASKVATASSTVASGSTASASTRGGVRSRSDQRVRK